MLQPHGKLWQNDDRACSRNDHGLTPKLSSCMYAEKHRITSLDSIALLLLINAMDLVKLYLNFFRILCLYELEIILIS